MSFGTALVSAVGLMELGLAQDTAVPTIEQRLSCRIEHVDNRALTLREALVQTLRGASLPGGIELFHRTNSEPPVTIEQGTSVRMALERIRSVRPELFIDTSSKEVLNVMDPQISNLLETRIANLSITNPAIGAAAIQEILSSPEVQARVANLELEEASRQLGFSALPKPGTARLPVSALRISDVTVRQALDATAAAMKRGIWIYEEWDRDANGTRSFALSFATQ